MSRKSKTKTKNNPVPASSPQVARAAGSGGRRTLIVAGAALLLAAGGGAFYYSRRGSASSPLALAMRPELASAHSPSLGDASAKVHMVEFLDPACGTCATFYPLVKQLMAEYPHQIRLSVRHVPFHKGSADVVRYLEASRKQGKYWQTLETLLSAQPLWVLNHTAHPELARPALAGLGLNMDRLLADAHAPEVAQRMAQDDADAKALDVSQTPEYFVNGRQMESFGPQQLRDLVRDAVRGAY